MASKLYGNFLRNALTQGVDLEGDDIRVALLTSSYTPDQDSHQFWNAVSTNEVSGTGYTADGDALANTDVSYDGPNNVVVFDADDVTWADSTITARYAVLYNNSPAAAEDKPLIGYVDFGSDQSSSNGNFTITWDAAGIIRITVA